jgi:hypothetical protein
VISIQAKLASFAHGVAPSLVQEILAVAARFMPGPTSSRVAAQGKDARSVIASALTRQSDDAARRNNQN